MKCVNLPAIKQITTILEYVKKTKRVHYHDNDYYNDNDNGNDPILINSEKVDGFSE